MKRLLTFDYKNGEYILMESQKVLFSINASDLKFDALKFYEGVYNGEHKSTNIQLINRVAGEIKNSSYIYHWLNDIINAICDEFDETDGDIIEESTTEFDVKKIIPLYDMAACAGEGLYIGENVSYSEIETDIQEADYAVKISGDSMEPTILDGSTVFVKQVEELHNGDIGIFNVNGCTMCKRYIKRGRGEKLVPDNKSGKYEEVKRNSEISCIIQGLVLNFE